MKTSNWAEYSLYALCLIYTKSQSKGKDESPYTKHSIKHYARSSLCILPLIVFFTVS